MRKSVLMLIAAVVIDLTASQRALAADIGRPPHPYVSPAYVPPVVPVLIPTWTGCYVGGNIGGAWSNVDLSGVSGVDASATNSALPVVVRSAAITNGTNIGWLVYAICSTRHH